MRQEKKERSSLRERKEKDSVLGPSRGRNRGGGIYHSCFFSSSAAFFFGVVPNSKSFFFLFILSYFLGGIRMQHIYLDKFEPLFSSFLVFLLTY